MATVIRVQDKHGRGMFQMGNGYGISVYEIPELKDLADRHNNFPNLWRDVVLSKYVHENGYVDGDDLVVGNPLRFAFKNINQFEDWVEREEVALLKGNGFRVYKIEVEKVIFSNYQALFDITTVTNSVDITELFLK